MVAATVVCKESNVFSLEDYMLDPPDTACSLFN